MKIEQARALAAATLVGAANLLARAIVQADGVAGIEGAIFCVAAVMALLWADDRQRKAEAARRDRQKNRELFLRNAAKYTGSETARRHREIISEANRWNEDYRTR